MKSVLKAPQRAFCLMTIYSKQKLEYLVLYQGIKESVRHQHLWTVLYDLLEALFCVHLDTQTQTLLRENAQELQSWLIPSSIGRIPGFSCPNSDNIDASSSKEVSSFTHPHVFPKHSIFCGKNKKKMYRMFTCSLQYNESELNFKHKLWNKNKHHKCLFY